MEFAINLTLAVQAINFIIALIILIKFFLEPAVAELSREDKERKKARQSIMDLQEMLRQKKEAALAQNREWQKQLYAEQPALEETGYARSMSFTQAPESELFFSPEIISTLARSIVEKVKSP